MFTPEAGVYSRSKDRSLGTERRPFPESDQLRLNALLKCFNFGPKAIAFLCIPSNDSISLRELADECQNVFKGAEKTASSPQNIRNYVTMFYLNGLIDITRVKASQGRPRIVIEMTEEGKEFGIPAAVATLQAEDAIDKSMFLYLGNAGSNSEIGLSTPAVRTLLIAKLAESNEPIRPSDLSREFKFPLDLVQNTLTQLNRQGLVTYVTHNAKWMEGKREYEIDLESSFDETWLVYPNVRSEPLAKGLYNACDVLRAMKLAITVDAAITALPDDVKKDWKSLNLRGEIIRLLGVFTAQGYLRQTSEMGCKVNDTGKRFCKELVSRYLAISSKNFLHAPTSDEINAVTDNINEHAVKSSNRYFEYSHHQQVEKMQMYVLSVAEALEAKELSIRELSRGLEIHEQSVRNYLGRLASGVIIGSNDYELKKVIRRGIAFYRLVPVESS